MYTYKEREKADKLLIKYDLNIAATIRKLGYPSRNALRLWYQEYIESGNSISSMLGDQNTRLSRKSMQLDTIKSHGRNMARTIKAIGYPHRETMREWIRELAPSEQKVCRKQICMVEYTPKQQKEAVIESFAGKRSVTRSADSLGVSRASLYKWKNKLLGEGCNGLKQRGKKPPLPDDRDTLLSEADLLKQQIYELQMEYDILRASSKSAKPA